MERDLDDSVWFVTGASAGFGRALCEQIMARGGRVAATARSIEAVEPLGALAPDRVLAAALDVAEPGQAEAAVALAEARFGRIDVLANCAGYGFLGAVEEASDAEIQAQFEVNFMGLVRVTRAVLPLMRARRSGRIVNFSSLVGVRGFLGSGIYGASKWAVEGLSESLAEELRPFGIDVLIVEPGPFRTDFSGRSIATPRAPIAAYREVADKRTRSKAGDGSQPGDPVRGAGLIIDAVLQPALPRRLILGAAAFVVALEAARVRLDEVELCRDLAAAADFPS